MRTAAIMVLLAALGGSRAGAAPLDADPDVEIARRHFERGAEHYAAGRYREAIGEFEAARRSKPLPDFDYNIARCYDRMEKAEPAIAAYQRYLDQAKDGDQAAEVRERIRVLQERTGPAPTPAPPARPAPPIVPLLVGGVAVAALGVGLGLYLSIDPEFAALEKSCAPDCARSSWQGLAVREQVAIGLLVAGGVAAAIDVVLWVLRARRSPAERAAFAGGLRWTF